MGLPPPRPFSAYQTICASDLFPWQRNLEVVCCRRDAWTSPWTTTSTELSRNWVATPAFVVTHCSTARTFSIATRRTAKTSTNMFRRWCASIIGAASTTRRKTAASSVATAAGTPIGWKSAASGDRLFFGLDPHATQGSAGGFRKRADPGSCPACRQICEAHESSIDTGHTLSQDPSAHLLAAGHSSYKHQAHANIAPEGPTLRPSPHAIISETVRTHDPMHSPETILSTVW